MSDDKNNLSQADKNPIISLLEEFILSMNTALKTLRLYSQEHPSFLDQIEKVKLKFNDLLEIENTLEIIVQKDKLLFQNEELGKENEKVRLFRELLYHLGIQSVIFRKGLDNEGIITFLSIIIHDPDEIMSGGGIASFIEEIKSPFIEIKEREKLEIIRDEELAQSEKSPEISQLSDEELLKEYFHQQEAGSEISVEKVFYILTEHPKKFFQSLIELEEKPFGDSYPAGEILDSQLDNITKITEKIAQDIQQKYLVKKRYYLQKLKDSLSFLPDEIKNNLIYKKLLPQLDTLPVVRDIIGEFSTAYLINIFHRKIEQDNLTLSQLKEILDKIPSLSQDKKAEVISGVEKQQKISDQKIDSIVTIPERVTEEFEVFSLDELENKVSELSTYSKEEIKEIEQLSSVCSKDDIMFSTTNVLLDVLPLINEVNIYLRFINMLQDFLEVYLSKTRCDMALKILKVFKEEFNKRGGESLDYLDKLETAIKEAASESKIYNLILYANDLDKNSQDFKIITSYLELLQEEAVDVLLVILGKEEKRIIRKLIVQILIDIGQKHIEILARRLSDERWYLVRNIVSIFGEIQDEKAIEYIRGILNHPNPRVRGEAIRSLGLIGTGKSVQLLFAALRDRDPELRQKAIRWLGEIANPVAIPQLAKILRKRDFLNRFYSMKEEAISALEKIGSPEATSVLEEISRKKWYQLGFRSKKLRLLANKSSQKLKNPDK